MMFSSGIRLIILNIYLEMSEIFREDLKMPGKVFTDCFCVILSFIQLEVNIRIKSKTEIKAHSFSQAGKASCLTGQFLLQHWCILRNKLNLCECDH